MPWAHGAIIPMVIVRMSRSTDLPTLDEIENLEIVKVLGGQRQIHINARLIEATSLRNIPPKLIFIGKYAKNMEEYNALDVKDIGYGYSLWNTLENDVIRDYMVFNVKANRNVIMIPKDWNKQMLEEFRKRQN